MNDDIERKGPRRFRLVWRWKETGTTGMGPWMHRAEVVSGWFESLTRRWGERIEHWIETEAGDPAEQRKERAHGRADARR